LLVFDEDKRSQIGDMLLNNWRNGLMYMLAVLAILGAHEMGHFLMSVRHRIPASWPFFIPMPISPFGTMGAVIAMEGYKANRKQLFDIGIAGPLAGLVVAIPITMAGIQQASVVDMRKVEMLRRVSPKPPEISQFHDPLLIEWLIAWQRPEVANSELWLNPLLMAGWVGFLITGLNMMPISQLDGGHISYALFGRRAHLLARLMVLAAVVFMVWMQVPTWSVMVLLVLIMGVDHPPTADDQVPLGKVRTILGWASLSSPSLCFPALGITTM
jgi:membrane-associated protease RseP (regulator of RpoE activity)